MSKIMEKRIGKIHNFYGHLNVKEEDEKYYWCINCQISENNWQEITKQLYNELINFENNI